VRFGVRGREAESKFDEVGIGQNGLRVVDFVCDKVRDEDGLKYIGSS
jgi:hypothetical protein